MIILLKICFWICALGLVHSYVFYPLLLRILVRNKEANSIQYQKNDALPKVSVLMAVYNEEKVIEEKLLSLLALDYPNDLLHIYIGSDCSSDQTNKIIEAYAQNHPNLHFFPFSDRRGKPDVINDLVEKCSQKNPIQDNHIFLMTDASVIVEKNTLWHLVKHFKNEQIAIVDANMLNKGMLKKGISKSENGYMLNEVKIKNREGIIWGQMMGPFGGCYALRSTYFTPIPPKYLVDDFFIAMHALDRKALAINELEAICYESVSHEIKEEYRRKSRISAGNFQNLRTFRHLLNPFNSLGFSFISHKVLRWLGPFFIIFALLSSGLIALFGNSFYFYLFLLQSVLLIGVPILDFLLKKLNIHFLFLRSITYFHVMNIALLEGFIKYKNGVKNNVWEPPKRN